MEEYKELVEYIKRNLYTIKNVKYKHKGNNVERTLIEILDSLFNEKKRVFTFMFPKLHEDIIKITIMHKHKMESCCFDGKFKVGDGYIEYTDFDVDGGLCDINDGLSPVQQKVNAYFNDENERQTSFSSPENVVPDSLLEKIYGDVYYNYPLM